MVYPGITSDDLQQRIKLLMFTRGVQPTDQTRQRIGFEALKGLIEEHLERQELERVQSLQQTPTAKSSLIVSDSEVDEEVAKLAQKNNLSYDQLKASFAAAGIDLNTLREQVRVSMGWQKLVGGVGGRALTKLNAPSNQQQ